MQMLKKTKKANCGHIYFKREMEPLDQEIRFTNVIDIKGKTPLLKKGWLCETLFLHALKDIGQSWGVKMTHTGNERRRHPRFEIPLEGELHMGNGAAPFRVRNLSSGGALIDVEADLRLGHLIRLEIPEIGMLTARTMRIHWKFSGVSLVEGGDKVSAFIGEWLHEEPELQQAD